MIRVPNAIQGREKPDLNIFAMQGVPRYLIEERILTGATNYWAKIKSEQCQKPKVVKEPRKKKENLENYASKAEQIPQLQEEGIKSGSEEGRGREGERERRRVRKRGKEEGGKGGSKE